MQRELHWVLINFINNALFSYIPEKELSLYNWSPT